jgi:hypothetical protein
MMNTATGICPSLEEIAAFLDGRLTGEDRARMVAHLADCPSCYEVFAEAARFQLEEEEEEAEDPPEVALPAAVVVPFLRKRPLPWIAPASIAAMLVIGLAALPLYQWYSQSYNQRDDDPMPKMISAELVSPELVKRAGGDEFWSKGTTRGTGKTQETFITTAEFLVGAHLVDLQLALARNDGDAALGRFLPLINQNTTNAMIPEPQRKFYSKTALGRLQSPTAQPRDLLPDADRTERSLDEGTSWPLAFGKWAEAGRLAASVQESGFFQDEKNRELLRWLLRNKANENVILDPEVVQALEKIRDLVDSSKASALPYGELETQLTSILDHYKSESLSDSEP